MVFYILFCSFLTSCSPKCNRRKELYMFLFSCSCICGIFFYFICSQIIFVKWKIETFSNIEFSPSLRLEIRRSKSAFSLFISISRNAHKLMIFFLCVRRVVSNCLTWWKRPYIITNTILIWLPGFLIEYIKKNLPYIVLFSVGLIL